jgi:outer membrane immunogenic protein
MKKFPLLALSLLTLSSTTYAAESGFEGFYAGAQIGVAEGVSAHTDNDYWYYDANDSKKTDRSASLGLKLGYDKVNGSVLYGVLAEGSITSINTQKEYSPEDPSYEVGAKINAFGSIRAKLGVASDKLAVYATGGLALADIQHKYNETDGSGQYYDQDGKKVGYVFGLGASYLVTDNSMIGVDVSRYVFGNKKHRLLESDGTPIDYDGYMPTFTQDDVINSANVSYSIKF